MTKLSVLNKIIYIEGSFKPETICGNTFKVFTNLFKIWQWDLMEISSIYSKTVVFFMYVVLEGNKLYVSVQK